MIKSILYLKGNTVVETSSEELANVYGKYPVWVDIENPQEDELAKLGNIFPIHKLTMEDCCMTQINRAGINEYQQYISMILYGLEEKDKRILHKQLNVILGKGFLVTVHKYNSRSTEEAKAKVLADNTLFKRGLDYLAYYIIDVLVDYYFAVFDTLDEKLDKLQNEILTKSSKITLSEVFNIKKNLIKLRRVVSPEREVINILAHREFQYIRPDIRIYFGDIYNHILRINEILESDRELLASMLEIYLSTVSNRLNEVMKVLTVIATMMLPLTFITGLYGMNFQFIPEIHTEWGRKYGYFFALGLMLLVAIIMLLYFRNKKWV